MLHLSSEEAFLKFCSLHFLLPGYFDEPGGEYFDVYWLAWTVIPGVDSDELDWSKRCGRGRRVICWSRVG